MYQYLDTTFRYEAIVREADAYHLARSVRPSRPRKPLLGWFRSRLVVRPA